MPKALKIFLIVFVSLALLGGGCFYAVSRFVDEIGPDLAQKGKKAKEEGEIWGKAHTQQQSLIEGIRRANTCSSELDILCLVEQKIFLKVSLEYSKPSPKFCDGVPKITEIWETTTWRSKRCSELAPDHLQICNNIIEAVQADCEERSAKSAK
ncbi:hypothetical protein [Leptospira sarikeiensis]|uniref:Lipoprotein n=1 Tax=Leptospira sarikeiensis TaxID=2484943 RepID=A0A4R9K9J1_9LEPT|nr:hypothetical protein [Leptospira sarikeiensis]TGL61413.1 hypothetical protein EHQ64_10520 [Leptospira sarikeiensis]